MSDSIFVVGHPRSGTSLFYNYFTSYFDFDAFPETHYFTELVDKVCSEESFIQAQNEIYGCVLYAYDLVAKDKKETFLTILSQHTAKSKFCEKTPDHLFHLPEIKSMFPAAKFIVIYRDPAATFYSEKVIGKWYEGLFLAVKKWRSGYKAALRNDTDCIFVNYEKFIQSPMEVLRKISFELDLPIKQVNTVEDCYRKSTLASESWKLKSPAKIMSRKNATFSMLGRIYVYLCCMCLFRKLEARSRLS